ncbi:hypothetical protein DFJ73DRAFT_788484 [Zopfochytrium polystomum]|nr:hypothetical protein DFJ73DRAFT_788484 [Zopfochytrium polystomum]
MTTANLRFPRPAEKLSAGNRRLAPRPRNLAFLASLLLVLPLLLSLLPGVSFVGVAQARPAPNPHPRPNPPNSPHHRERSSSLEDLRQDLDNRYHADTPVTLATNLFTIEQHRLRQRNRRKSVVLSGRITTKGVAD